MLVVDANVTLTWRDTIFKSGSRPFTACRKCSPTRNINRLLQLEFVRSSIAPKKASCYMNLQSRIEARIFLHSALMNRSVYQAREPALYFLLGSSQQIDSQIEHRFRRRPFFKYRTLLFLSCRRTLSTWQRGVSNWRAIAPCSPMLAFPRKCIYHLKEIQNSFLFFFTFYVNMARVVVYPAGESHPFFSLLFFSFSIIVRSCPFSPNGINVFCFANCNSVPTPSNRDAGARQPIWNRFTRKRLSWTSRLDNAHFSHYVSFQLFDKFFTNSNPNEIRVNAHRVNARATVSKKRERSQRGRARERERERKISLDKFAGRRKTDEYICDEILYIRP